MSDILKIYFLVEVIKYVHVIINNEYYFATPVYKTHCFIYCILVCTLMTSILEPLEVFHVRMS